MRVSKQYVYIFLFSAQVDGGAYGHRGYNSVPTAPSELYTLSCNCYKVFPNINSCPNLVKELL